MNLLFINLKEQILVLNFLSLEKIVGSCPFEEVEDSGVHRMEQIKIRLFEKKFKKSEYQIPLNFKNSNKKVSSRNFEKTIEIIKC